MTGAVAEVAAEEVAGADAFRERIVARCVPVVMRGLASDWPVTRAASASPRDAAEYLARFDSGRTAEAFVGEPAIGGRYTYGNGPTGFNFARETMTLTAALARITAAGDGRTLYVGSLPADAHLPGFAEDNSAPWLPPTVRPRIWIGHASTVACHHDNSDNLACVVAGRRRFTLFPPDAIGDLYVGPIDHTMAGQPIALAVGADDDALYPRFAAARGRASVAELAPGDAIYVPKLWWHQVEAIERFNILVNAWWDAFPTGDAPYTTMLLAAAAVADRPAEERAAWRAYFDHYVFRPNDHPLAHLPPERHGVLARGAGGRLRALAMKLLRGG
jgi:hypothetical protein